MTKLEKVIKGLEHCHMDNCTEGSKCPYYGEEYCLINTLMYDALGLLKAHALYFDALEILKAQTGATAKRGTWDERQVESDNIWTRRRFYCSCCGGWQTYGKTKYCPNCGAEMGEGVTNDA